MDFYNIYERHCRWSKKAFGPTENRSIDGVIEHLRLELDEVKEAAEALEKAHREAPGSRLAAMERQRISSEFTFEVADIIILAMEMAHVMRVPVTQLCALLTKKQDMNESRKWPAIEDQEPGKPIEHLDD